MEIKYSKDATAISEDEIYNLLPLHLTTQKELDEWEQLNIVKASLWLKNKKTGILSMDFIKKLHKQMFNDTWRWAGSFRTIQTNIGVESIYIPQELKILIDDVEFWLEKATYGIREIGVRLHHRLVLIHPFVNGNGRLARLYADKFMELQGERIFSWGNCNLVNDSDLREKYISALRKADRGDYAELIRFSDS